MKVAVSLPDDLFEEAEQLAENLGTSRSALYARALAEFISGHSAERVTQGLDQAIAMLDPDAAPFVSAAARSTLARSQW